MRLTLPHLGTPLHVYLGRTPVRLLLLIISFAAPILASTAPSVTNLHAIHHNGQTFIVWTDAAAGAAGAKYRYDLYRSTAGAITNLSQATLVQQGIHNNSGQLIGPKPFNQATRQKPTLRMSVITQGGESLPLWSGLAVYTSKAAESAYYAVITRDNSGAQEPSPPSPTNVLQAPVKEEPAPIVPVLQVPSSDPQRNPNCCSISVASELPLWLRLHGSGGRAGEVGDLQAFWGDANMGYQDGIQSIFSVFEDHSGDALAKGGARKLIMAPQDAVWSVDGNSFSETFWYGYKDVPNFARDRQPHVYPFTRAKLSLIVPWVVQHYNADRNRIYGISESMGAYGQINWSLQQPNLFAAIFMRIPILGPWQRIPSLIDLTPTGKPKTVATTTDTLPDGITLYNKDTDVSAWVAEDCSRNLPYLSWASGRNDIGLANHRMWTYAVRFANALRACHYGFSFVWGNGRHDAATGNLENSLLEQYQTVFARNISYPAFTNSSADDNYGKGEYDDGDSSGCVNCGWQWTIESDTNSTWSVSLTNNRLRKSATVDITPRNLQLFTPVKTTLMTWSTSTGQQGQSEVDRFGLVTARGVHLNAQETITVTFSK